MMKLKIIKQEEPEKSEFRSRTLETKKKEKELGREREEEFYRLKNLQARLTENQTYESRNEIKEEFPSENEEQREYEFYTNWEKQINSQNRPSEAQQKKMLANLLRENNDPEIILKKSLNLNKKSMFLINNKKQKKTEKMRPQLQKEISESEESTDLGETGEMLKFYEKRNQQYSKEKEELWSKVNKLMNDLKDTEEELELTKNREKKMRSEKRNLEDQLGELQVKIGREVQKTFEMETEVKQKDEELQELQKYSKEERENFENQKKQLGEAMQRISHEKGEIEQNAEKINQRNTELQDFIDNQEVSLGRLRHKVTNRKI